MTQKFKTVKYCKVREYFNDYTEIVESVYFCDMCNKEMSQSVYFEKGGRLTLIRGNAGNKYEMYLELCESCINKMLQLAKSEKTRPEYIAKLEAGVIAKLEAEVARASIVVSAAKTWALCPDDGSGDEGLVEALQKYDEQGAKKVLSEG